MSGTRYLTEETLDQYLRYVTRWKTAGPLPVEWLPTLTLESQHTARSALLWYHRETGGNVICGRVGSSSPAADPCHVF